MTEPRTLLDFAGVKLAPAPLAGAALLLIDP